jgi:uncharacterized protein with NRDE domain
MKKRIIIQPVAFNNSFPCNRYRYMCLLIFAHRVSPDYPLLVAANRDEFYARPTASSDFWPEHPGLLAGRDLQQGGTWMGVTTGGRFAAVTNYRDPSGMAVAPRSRGELPLAYLTGSASAGEFLKGVATRAGEYAGFNLLVGDGHNLWHYTNSDKLAPRKLSRGIYGLSNATLNTPWPKVELGKSKLSALCQSGKLSHDALVTIVADRTLADQSSLKRQGLDGAMDPVLSAQFIVTGTYGTRSSTTLWRDDQGRSSWREQSFDERGEVSNVQQKEFASSEP